jgi:hypothetical protein
MKYIAEQTGAGIIFENFEEVAVAHRSLHAYTHEFHDVDHDLFRRLVTDLDGATRGGESSMYRHDDANSLLRALSATAMLGESPERKLTEEMLSGMPPAPRQKTSEQHVAIPTLDEAMEQVQSHITEEHHTTLTGLVSRILPAEVELHELSEVVAAQQAVARFDAGSPQEEKLAELLDEIDPMKPGVVLKFSGRDARVIRRALRRAVAHDQAEEDHTASSPTNVAENRFSLAA